MRIVLFALFAALFLVPASAHGQSTLYGYDIYQSGGLFSMSPSASSGFAGYFRPGIGESVYSTFAMDLNSAGTEIFAIDQESGYLGKIDPSTGSFEIVGPVSGALDPSVDTPTGLSVDPSSAIVYVCTTNSLYTIDPLTANCTFVGSFSSTGGDAVDVVLDIAVDNSGNLFLFDYDSLTAVDNGRLWVVNTSNAQATLIGSSGIDHVSFAQGMDFDPATNVLYSAIFASNEGEYGGEYGTWNTSTGVFTSIDSLQVAGDSEYEMTISGGLCYVLNFLDGNSIATFPVNLPAAPGIEYRPPVATPYAMDFDATGNSLYAIDVNTGFPYSVGTLDKSTGAIARISELSGDYASGGVSVPVGMTCDATTGTFFIADVWNLYELDVATGETELVGPFGIAGGLAVELAASPSGDLYCLDAGTNSLYQVDKSNGSATWIGASGTSVAAFVQGLDFDPANGILYSAGFRLNSSGAPAGSYGTWNTATGRFTEIMPLQSLNDPEGDGKQFKLAIQHIPTVVDLSADTFDIIDGELRAGGIPELLNSDNGDASVSRNPLSLQSRVIYDVETTSSSADPLAIEFTIEESVFARGNVSRTVRMFNYDTGQFETVDVRNASRLGDRVDSILVDTGAGRFVETGSNRMRVRVRYDGPVARASFTCNVDQLFWTVTD